MADGQVLKRAKYKTSVWEPGVSGVLEMTEDKFTFMPDDPNYSARISMEFRYIKGHRFSREGSSKQALLKLTQVQGGNYIFEFESFSDRDICREFAGNRAKKLRCREVIDDNLPSGSSSF